MCVDFVLLQLQVQLLLPVLQVVLQVVQLYAPKARSHPVHKAPDPLQQQPRSFYNCTSLLGRQRMSVVGPLGQLPPWGGA